MFPTNLFGEENLEAHKNDRSNKITFINFEIIWKTDKKMKFHRIVEDVKIKKIHFFKTVPYLFNACDNCEKNPSKKLVPCLIVDKTLDDEENKKRKHEDIN